MSFLDKLKNTAELAVSAAGVAATKAAVVGKAAAETAVKQTKTAAAITKVKLEIASQEDKLKKCYTNLGWIFFRDYENQAEAVMEEYQPWCDRASAAKAELKKLNQQLEELRGVNTPDEPQTDAPEVEPVPDAEEIPYEEASEEPGEVPEDTSIYADFVEAQPAEVVLAYEDDGTHGEDAEEAPVAGEPEIPDISKMSDVIGTFYLDVTGQEE